VGGQDDLETAVKAIMAARREELGEPPSPEELLAYRDGRLEPEKRARLETAMALHPDAARALADLAAFPDVEAAPGTPEIPEITEEDVTARWQAFQKRLPERPAGVLNSKVGEGLAPSRAGGRISSRRRWRAPWLAAAALVLFGFGWLAGFFEHMWQGAGPEINVQTAELLPRHGDEPRSAPSPVELQDGSEELMLVLGGDLHGEHTFREYEADVQDAAGRRLWSRHGLRPTAMGTFQLAFHRAAFRPGTYRIDLFGRGPEGRIRLATYDLRLADNSAP
jgi:hypothetical protein